MKNLILIILLTGIGMHNANAQADKTCCEPNGKMEVKMKLTRYVAPKDNFLPSAIGYVAADPASADGFWVSPLEHSTVERMGTGHYKLSILNARLSPRASVIVTPQSTTPKICTVKYVSPGIMEVYVFNLDGTAVNGAFAFMISDPVNLFD